MHLSRRDLTSIGRRSVDRWCLSHHDVRTLWNRHDFPGATVLEIRPSVIRRDEPLTDVIGFKADRIESWIQQGYEDARRCVGDVLRSLEVALQADHGRADAAAAAEGASDAVRLLLDRPFEV